MGMQILKPDMGASRFAVEVLLTSCALGCCLCICIGRWGADNFGNKSAKQLRTVSPY